MIFPNRLPDNPFIKYSWFDSLAFMLLLNVSINLFLVHLLEKNPGAIAQFSIEYQNSSPLESIALMMPLSSTGKAVTQQAANALILYAAISLSAEITTNGYIGFLNNILNSIRSLDIVYLECGHNGRFSRSD